MPSIVRWRTSNSRVQCSVKAVSYCFVSIGSNRIDGRVTASDHGRLICVLAAFDVFHIARRYQSGGLTERLQLTAPVMRGRIRFNPDLAARQLIDCSKTLARLPRLRNKTAPATSTPSTWNTVSQTNCANIAYGRFPQWGSFKRNHPMAHRCRRVVPCTASITSLQHCAAHFRSVPNNGRDQSDLVSAMKRRPAMRTIAEVPCGLEESRT
jgi:hypothetical protein